MVTDVWETARALAPLTLTQCITAVHGELNAWACGTLKAPPQCLKELKEELKRCGRGHSLLSR